MKSCLSLLLIGTILLPHALAQSSTPQAAKVVVCRVEEGAIARTREALGSVYYKEMSNLATEVEGKVVEVLFEEGEHLDEGTVMVRLDSSLLESDLRAAKARTLQAETDVKLERARLERGESLLKDEVTTPQQYDDMRFTVEAAEHRLEQAKAEVNRIERELEKKTIRAPYDGRVIERMTEVGDWKSAGATVAIFARDDLFDVIVNVQEDILRYVKPATPVDVRVAGTLVPGEIVTVIPKGDIPSRMFPVKIRVEGRPWILEAMSAQAQMPASEEMPCMVVPRDAVIRDGHESVVYRVEDGRAVRAPVDVVGYEGLTAGIRGDGIHVGAVVVTKGHERLRPGQAVEIIESS
ncbi:MAG: hypothetical protein AMXMBFR4_10190 [Candidatus Hydrogenedentota bacterium]